MRAGRLAGFFPPQVLGVIILSPFSFVKMNYLGLLYDNIFASLQL